MKAAIFAIVLLIVTAGAADPAQDSLNAAKDLYESAAYEEAVSVLNRLRASPAHAEVSQQVDRYLAFCLFALGRTAEAEAVTESLFRRDPLLRLGENDAAPRIEEMFSSVRSRLLPELIRAEYQQARASAERKDLAAADAGFRRVRQLLDEAVRLGRSDEALDDLALTVDGFLALTHAASDAAPAPPALGPLPGRTQPPPASAGAPPVESMSSAHIYDSTDADVTPPVAVFERAPVTSWPTPVAVALTGVRRSGVVSIVIDEKGNVVDAAIVEPIHPAYDRLLLSAVHTWKYKPATRAGAAVKYRENVRIELK